MEPREDQLEFDFPETMEIPEPDYEPAGEVADEGCEGGACKL